MDGARTAYITPFVRPDGRLAIGVPGLAGPLDFSRVVAWVLPVELGGHPSLR
jgi:hypothetical protein